MRALNTSDSVKFIASRELARIVSSSGFGSREVLLETEKKY